MDVHERRTTTTKKVLVETITLLVPLYIVVIRFYDIINTPFDATIHPVAPSTVLSLLAFPDNESS